MKHYVSYYDGTKKYTSVSELADSKHAGLMSPEDKAKLDALSEGLVPTNIEGSKVIQDATHRFVTDVEKTAWNNKADKTLATTTAAGLMSPEDKAKLDAMSTSGSSSEYVHPDTHPATMITQDATHRFVTDVEKTAWNSKADKSLATTTTDGLMSKEDKVILDMLKADSDTEKLAISAEVIKQDETHKFVTEEQLTKIECIPSTIDTFDYIYDPNEKSVAITATLIEN